MVLRLLRYLSASTPALLQLILHLVEGITLKISNQVNPLLKPTLPRKGVLNTAFKALCDLAPACLAGLISDSPTLF